MINRERMIDTFLDLVAIDSESRHEKGVAEYLLRALQDMGCEARVDDAAGRTGSDTGNVIARVPATREGAPPLLLSAHMDTVPPGNGVKPVREHDRIRSDGSTVLGGDDKSGLAVIVESLRTVHERSLPHGELEIAFTVCEEIGLLGAKHVDFGSLKARQGFVLDSPDASLLFTHAPSSDRFEFVVHGLEAHAGVAPETGISAVRVAAEAIAAMPLGRIDPQSTSNVVVIEGGEATNVVPNRCVVRGETRSLDDARLDEITGAVRRCFQDAAGGATTNVQGTLHRAWIEERCHREYHAMAIAEDAPIVRLLMRAAQHAGTQLQTASIGGGCDANVFNKHGIESVNFGTGMRAIHTVNEWLDLNDFYRCADVVLASITL